MTYQPITRGVICPTITPLKRNGDINSDMIRPLVDFLIDKGIAGIYPLGSTGEGPLFSTDERKAVAAATVEAVAGRVPVIVHTGAMTTAETIELDAPRLFSRRRCGLGDYALVFPAQRSGAGSALPRDPRGGGGLPRVALQLAEIRQQQFVGGSGDAVGTGL